MVRKVVLTDDLDETLEASVTEIIGFRGFFYKIDLTEEHAEAMAADFEKWVGAAHEKVRWLKANKPQFASPDVESLLANSIQPAEPKQRRKPSAKLTPEERAEARAWGRENGYEVASRGTLPDALVKAWRKASRARAKS